MYTDDNITTPGSIFASGWIADTGYDEITGTVGTTSGALEDITGLSLSLTVPAGAPSTAKIIATMSVETSTTGGAPATGAWAISIAGVDGTEIGRYLSGTNDTGALVVLGRATSLPAGVHVVKGRHRRASGAATVNSDVAQLSAFVVLD